MAREAEHDELQSGGDLLLRLSNEMVRAQKRFFGKGASSAKSYMLDDLLITVLRGGMTTAEHTLVDSGQEDKVRDFRQVFENEMAEQLTRIVEEITGRNVINFQSQVMFDPDLVVEIFVFDQPLAKAPRASQPRLDDDATGEASDVGAPSDQGR